MPKSISKYTETNLIKEIVVALIISLGGFATLLPNVLEGIGILGELPPYKTMLLFAIIYFLVLLFIILCYWLLRGWKLYLKEKLLHANNNIEFFEIEKISVNCNNISTNNINIKTVYKISLIKIKNFWALNKFNYLVLFKIILLASFFKFEWIVNNDRNLIVLIILFLVIAYIQIISVFIESEKYFKYFENNEKNEKVLGEEVINNILVKSYFFNIKILSLDLFVLLGFILFNQPWIIYRNNLVLWIFGVLLTYIILFSFTLYFYSRSHIFQKQNKNVSKQLDGKYTNNITNLILYFVLIAFCCIAFPSVNQENFINLNYCLPTLTLVLIISYHLIFKVNNLIHWTNTLVVAILLSFCIDYLIKEVTTKLNKNYLYSRRNASNQISNEKYDPFMDFGITDSVNRINRIKYFSKNNLNFAITKRVDSTDTLASYYDKSDSTDRTKYTLPGSSIQYKFFYKYVKLEKSPDNLNTFYGDLYSYINDTIINKNKYVLNYIKDDDSLKFIFHQYDHPVNYYNSLIKTYQKQLKYSQELNILINDIHRLIYLTDLKIDTLDSKNKYFYEQNKIAFNNKIERRNHFLKDNMKNIIEFHDTYDFLNSDVINNKENIKMWSTFFQNFHQHKVVQYNERFKRAQIMYQSYLIDLQRIGIFMFLVQLIVFVFLSISNYKENKRFSIMYSEQPFEDNNKFAADSPMYTFITAVFISFILILPLSREIRAENINPEDPYWMLKISNWYTPRVVDEVLNPTESAKPQKYTNVEQIESIREFDESTMVVSPPKTNVSSNDLDSLLRELNKTAKNILKEVE